MVVHYCKPSTQDIEAGETWQVWGQTDGLLRKFQASQGCNARYCLFKNPEKEKET